ncbi:(2Fe-2S)-binding protein [Planktomarina temperata]|jgi:carbon-monoxide dehydrogenase small subunit|uniref:(2Fe-2S)-binding protein n=1 Tax=Lentibacter algarum TaxID=576131 RepID=UPI0023158A17|nr:(2Fe-2S)-binding protein [Lentibacter algarum]MCO4841020.1 (2Fe-2S)-binding protein [Paracoccaceae bacterium]MDA9810376.1 (2Fe-2S)-binding protein [Planktomarina temperata]MDB0018426.1 (2Fe-2S)-binding protein [Planktomarina temperata]MDC1059341.1 (2Fe-2S)-binding protein [Planktomarina temperata]MDC6453909.1 (2Fe-2S)-binding protein [Planktomarina temperata]
MSRYIDISLRVNGEDVRATVPSRLNLVDFLREELSLTGSHVGCEHGVCGACTLTVNGDTVRGCLMLAAQADGKEITTIEGLAENGQSAQLQAAFTKHNALQCGFCTPGMLASALGYLNTGGSADRDAIRQHISGNYCRCTGYQSIVNAICDVIEETSI